MKLRGKTTTRTKTTTTRRVALSRSIHAALLALAERIGQTPEVYASELTERRLCAPKS